MNNTMDKNKMESSPVVNAFQNVLYDKKEILYRKIAENISDVIWTTDLELKLTYVSPSVCKLTGGTPAEHMGIDLADRFPPDSLKKIKAVLAEELEFEKNPSIDKNRSRLIEIEQYKIDGSTVWVSMKVSFIRGDNGEAVGILGTTRDISESKQMEKELFLEKERFKATLLSVADGVISTDENGNILLLNNAAEKLCGWTQAEAEGTPFTEVFHIINEDTREITESPVKIVLETGKMLEIAGNTALIRKDGKEISIEESAAPIINAEGETQGVVLVFRDVTEKRRVRNQIEHISYHDYLTGLYNRRYFEEELKRMDNKSNLPISIIVVDVNGLKLTNDAFGHEMGDTLLKKVADVLRNACRVHDIIARMGGDEFAIMLPETNSVQTANIKKRILDNASKETLGSAIISVALGYDTKQSGDQDIYEVLKQAENYMYRDKIHSSRKMRNQTIQLIINTLNTKYVYEQKHTEGVGLICKKIGAALSMSQNDMDSLETAGFLHDIGKIIIPYDILYKPGRLTREEYETIKRHSESGYQILRSTDDFSLLAESVLYHHERWDGHGYPQKLKAQEIPLFARIIAVADAYEAMIAGRQFQDALSKADAVHELINNAGTQFDPEIVRVFVEKVSDDLVL